MSHAVGFTTFETAFPQVIYTNEDPPFSYYPKTCGASGIIQRHIAHKETVASLAVAVIERLRSSVAGEFGDFNAFVLSTTSYAPNHIEAVQHIAEEVAEQTNIRVFETVNFACSGFSAAVQKALRLSGEREHVAVVCSEIPSTGIDFLDFKTFPLFGDGAAAGSISPKGKHTITKAFVENVVDESNCIGFRCAPFADIHEEVHTGRRFHMSGAEVMAKAIDMATDIVSQENHDDGAKIIVPHQAGRAILDRIQLGIQSRGLNWPVINRLGETGNLVSASVPAALSSLFKEGGIPRGTHIICPTFGGGEALQNGWMSKGLVSFMYNSDVD